MDLKDLTEGFAGLSEAKRPIRLRLSQEQHVLDDVLLVKRVTGSETLCGGLEYRLLCISTRAYLPLKEFIALPVEVQFVTDRGDLRAVGGIVAQAAADEKGSVHWREHVNLLRRTKLCTEGACATYCRNQSPSPT
jgi:type VI secretion system secreted protein VgrG